jgi:hypothetical protein
VAENRSALKYAPPLKSLHCLNPWNAAKKIIAKSSGLGVAEKPSLARISAAGGKPKCALMLFGSDSSASDGESAPSQRPRKRPRESSILKQITKPPLTRGMFD